MHKWIIDVVHSSWDSHIRCHTGAYISISCWGDLIGVVVHGRMVSVDYLLHVEPFVTLGHIPHFDEMNSFMPCIYDYLFYTGNWYLYDQLLLLQPVYLLIWALSSVFSWFVILWLATYDFAWDWDGSHQISPREHWWTPQSRVYDMICFRHSHFFCQIVMCICWALCLRSVDKEFIWDIKRFVFILLEIFITMCCFFLITIFAATCFIQHFNNLMHLWYWGISPM